MAGDVATAAVSARAPAVKYTDNPRVIRSGPLQAANVEAGH